jgi:hypothetical protein
MDFVARALITQQTVGRLTICFGQSMLESSQKDDMQCETERLERIEDSQHLKRVHWPKIRLTRDNATIISESTKSCKTEKEQV